MQETTASRILGLAFTSIITPYNENPLDLPKRNSRNAANTPPNFSQPTKSNKPASPVKNTWSPDELEVSSAAVSKWYTKWLDGGSTTLSAKPHLEPGRSITREDQQKLLDAVKPGALHWGFTVDCWTGKRIADVCQRVTGIDFHPSHIRRLMHALSFSMQE